MNGPRHLAARAVAWYGACGPAHPGRWRVVEGLRALLGLRRGHRSPVTVRRHGAWFELDPDEHIDGLIYYHGIYEPWNSRFLSAVVRPGWTALDIGANIGWFTVLLGQLTAPGGAVYAFELCAEEFRKLGRNIELNRFTHVHAVLAAVADRPGAVRVTAHRSAGMTAIAQSAAEAAGAVPCVTVDGFVAERGLARVDVIKVDIEGAESQFLAGAQATLARWRPAVLIELNAEAAARFGSSCAAVADGLRQLGYRLYRPLPTGLEPATRLPAGKEYWNVAALPTGADGPLRLDWAAVADLPPR